jgi:Kef-type K+ transport system membrane component KefB
MDHDLLTGISASIVAAAVGALLARRARQPLILGYILGGIVLGPNLGLGVVADEAAIEVIAEIGLILLLFLIGLEISIPRLLQAGRVLTVSGLLQFPICAALVWLVAVAFVPAGGQPFDRLYVAVAFALSSTLIVVKLLSDKFEISTFAGRVTLGILVFQDLWAIGFLALQPNLQQLEPAPLVRSFAAGAGLVAVAVVLSRYVLPRLYRAIATSPELLLIVSIAWCLLLSATAGLAGLSREMGALIAGLVIAAFPYGAEVISRLSGVRDFFVTLFFVVLGLKTPEPSAALVLLALAAAALVILTRLLTIFPIFAALRLDTRTAGVVAINLSQISEFSLVIVTLGVRLGQASEAVASLVLYTMLVTSVLSTYGILFNDSLAAGMARILALTGVPRWRRAAIAPIAPAPGAPAPVERDVFLLGVCREGLAFLQHLDREFPEMKQRVVAIDFNPETLERLHELGVECHYGDISNLETLRHAGIESARVAISTISDWFLKGTTNARLLQQLRRMVPGAQIVVTADSVVAARELYAAGADYVLVPPALSAEHLYGLLRHDRPVNLAEARHRQARELFGGDRAPRYGGASTAAP